MCQREQEKTEISPEVHLSMQTLLYLSFRSSYSSKERRQIEKEIERWIQTFPYSSSPKDAKQLLQGSLQEFWEVGKRSKKLREVRGIFAVYQEKQKKESSFAGSITTSFFDIPLSFHMEQEPADEGRLLAGVCWFLKEWVDSVNGDLEGISLEISCAQQDLYLVCTIQ